MDIEKIKFRLSPLGEPKLRFNQLKYNCPICESKGNLLNKFNLEININSFQFHCWACNYKGHINKLIKEQGLGKEFVFDNNLIKNNIQEIDNEIIELVEPKFYNQKFTKEQIKHFNYRGANIENLKRLGFNNIYSGENKNALYIKSYNVNGELNYYIIYNFKKYIKPQGIKLNKIMFGESNIDYNFPITITEGIWDTVVTINSFPLLGLKLNDRHQYLLSNKSCLLMLDEIIDNKIYLYIEKQLKEICKNFEIIKIPKGFKDPSYCIGTRKNNEFKNYYLKTISNLANN